MFYSRHHFHKRQRTSVDERPTAWDCISLGRNKYAYTSRLLLPCELPLTSICYTPSRDLQPTGKIQKKPQTKRSSGFVLHQNQQDMCVPLYSISANWLRRIVPKPPGVMQADSFRCFKKKKKEHKATASGVREWTESHWAAKGLDRDGQQETLSVRGL